MHVLTNRDEDIGGADAVIFLTRYIWWAWPFYALAQLPQMRRLVHCTYRWMAGRRDCTHITCELARSEQWAHYSPSHWRGSDHLRTLIHWTLFLGYGALASIYFTAAFWRSV